MKYEATMSAGCQVTVPSAVRQALGLKPGDKLLFDTDTLDAEKKTMAVGKALSREEQLKQFFAGLEEWREGLSDETKEMIKKHAGWTANQYHEYYDNLPEAKEYMRKKYGV